jgi:hypothetical protein
MLNVPCFNRSRKNVTEEEFLEGLLPNGEYSHLRLILSKTNNCQFGKKYLMVTQTGFGIVKLCDIDYSDNEIQIYLQDISSGIIQHFSIDVNDNVFRFFLLAWDDIRKMVLDDTNCKPDDDKLLDFDFR